MNCAEIYAAKIKQNRPDLSDKIAGTGAVFNNLTTRQKFTVLIFTNKSAQRANKF